MSSKTASCAQDLLDACRTGDYKHFMECVTSGGVLYELDNGIARLLKKVSQATFDEIGRGVGARPSQDTHAQRASGGWHGGIITQSPQSLAAPGQGSVERSWNLRQT